MQGLFGIVGFILLAWLISENRKKFPARMVIVGILSQLVLYGILTQIPFFSKILSYLNTAVSTLDAASKAGSGFVFGYIGGSAPPFEVALPQNNFIIAFQILPIIIVVSAISSLLYHYGILQKVIGWISLLLQKFMRTDGATALGVASSIFLGIIESPLFIKPYLKKMSRSGLFTLITAGMATVAGTVIILYATLLNGVVTDPIIQILIASVMSAPAALMFAQIIIPEDSSIEVGHKNLLEVHTKSPFEAIINGTQEGIQMVISIAGILIVLFAFIYLINQGIGIFNSQLTLQQIAGWLFYPFCFLMGIPTEDLSMASELMGIKTVLNEFVAYSTLSQSQDLQESTKYILTYALCGFANFGSLGILVGGLGSLVPERKEEVVNLSLKAIIAGTLSTMFTGTLVGLFY